MQCDGMQVIQMMAVVEMTNDGPIAYWWVSIETLRYTSTTIHTATLAGLRLLTSDGIHLAHVAFGKRVWHVEFRNPQSVRELRYVVNDAADAL
jgi:hypothetical protein